MTVNRYGRRAPFAFAGVLALAAASSGSEEQARSPIAPSISIPLAEPLPPRLPGAPSRIEAIEPARAEQAREINAALPFAKAPVVAAQPFLLAAATAADEARAQLCLTQAIYYEAGYEPIEGRRAVAQVVLNRVRHAGFPKSVCGVVYDGSNAPGCQFSFTCDGSLRRTPGAAAWRAAAAIAAEALHGHVVTAVGQATHYHTDWVAPYWAPTLTKITQIGAHIFYRFPGRWGAAASVRYAGREPVETPVISAPAAELASAPPERRAPDDLGGRLDPSKGWKLSIPAPEESRRSLADVTSSQMVGAQSAAALSIVSGGNGG
jgi:hypothetical protein